MTDAERRAWLKNLHALDNVIVASHPYRDEEVWSTPIPVEKTGAGKQYGFKVDGEWYDSRGERRAHRTFYTSTWYSIRPVPTPEEYAAREAKKFAEDADRIARKEACEHITARLAASEFGHYETWHGRSIPTAALIEIAAAMPDCAAIIAKHKVDP